MNRRTLTTGAAWTLPAIVVAAAAPSLAASPQPTRVNGTACKMPGNSGSIKHGYRVTLTVTPTPEVVVPISVLLGTGKYAQIVDDPTDSPDGLTFTVDATSSPSSLIVTVLVDGVEHVVDVKAFPRCPS